jgi:hypothetical protein
MTKPSLCIVASLVLVGAGSAWTQTAAGQIIRHSFKGELGGWVGVGQTAKVTTTGEASIVGPDAGALKFDYAIAKGQFNALALQTAAGSLKNAKSMRFRIRTDFPTLVAVALQEEDGGRYVALVQAPKDAWQTVELSTGDFGLSMEKNDPKDPNGRLDMEKINGVVIGDVSQFLAQAEGPASDLFDIPKGAHTLYLGEFTVGSDSVTPRTVSAGQDVRLDTFAHPHLSWFGVGGAKLSRASGKPLDGAGLRVDYRQTPSKLTMFTTPLLPWVLTTSKALSFDAASVEAARLIVQVEENDGGKYNTMIEVPAGSTAKRFRLSFADFKPADDSKDASGKLELGNVKSIVIVDVSGLVDGANKDNTLWIGNLLATSA